MRGGRHGVARAPELRKEELRVHAGPHQLDRDLPLVLIVGSLGQVHRAHTAAAQHAYQPVRADPPPWESAMAGMEFRDRAMHFALHKARRGFVARQECTDLRLKRGVAAARRNQPGIALRGRQIGGLMKEILDPVPPLRRHVPASCLTPQWIHASASRCSRPTVAIEVPSACTVSSTLRPQKRSSLTPRESDGESLMRSIRARRSALAYTPGP